MTRDENELRDLANQEPPVEARIDVEPLRQPVDGAPEERGERREPDDESTRRPAATDERRSRRASRAPRDAADRLSARPRARRGSTPSSPRRPRAARPVRRARSPRRVRRCSRSSSGRSPARLRDTGRTSRSSSMTSCRSSSSWRTSPKMETSRIVSGKSEKRTRNAIAAAYCGQRSRKRSWIAMRQRAGDASDRPSQ